MQANDLIKDSLEDLMVIKVGGTPSTANYTAGLRLLNQIIKSWSSDSRMIYKDSLEELSIPASTQSFTIGATGDQVTTRPVKILTASLKEGTTEYPLHTHEDPDQYQRHTDKSVTSLPDKLYYVNTWPNGTIYFDSTTDKAYTLILTSMKQLTEFPDGTTDISIPDSYEAALATELTLRIAPKMGAANRLTQQHYKQAKEAKDIIIGQSWNMGTSSTELRTPGSYNINSDDY